MAPAEICVAEPDFRALLGDRLKLRAAEMKIGALEESLDNVSRQRDLYAERAKVLTEIRDAYKELAAINAAKYEAAKEQLKEKRAAGFWPKVRERCAEGALVGSLAGTAMPGVGNLAGLAGGCIVGGIIGAVEGVAAP